MQSRETEEGKHQASDASTDTNVLKSRAAFWGVYQNRVQKPKLYIMKIQIDADVEVSSEDAT